MVNLGNGIIQLEAGEKVPFSCPNCHEFIPFNADLEIVICPVCKHEGLAQDFCDTSYEAVKTN